MELKEIMNIFSCLSLLLTLSITSIACASHSSFLEAKEEQKKVTTLETLHAVIRARLEQEARLRNNVVPSAFSDPSLIVIKEEPLGENEKKSLKRPRDVKKSSNTNNAEIQLPIKGERPFKGQKTKQGSIAIIHLKGEQVDDVLEWEWLPNELLLHVASFLSMKDLHAFKTVSTRAHRIYQSLITSTNFLTSDRPYAQDFRSIFNEVIFEPQPQAIRLVNKAVTKNGDIEVRFRDTEHLKQIVDETPEIMPKFGNLYFVRDEMVEDGKELVASSGSLEKSYFIHIVSNKPVKLRGELHLPCGIVLPQHSKWDECYIQMKGSLSTGKLTAYQHAHELAVELDTFDEHLFKTRTKEAKVLLDMRKIHRRTRPNEFPSLQEICPDSMLVADKNVRIIQKDYIKAEKPFIYRATSITALEQLREELPDLERSIAYIDSKHDASGVYCSEPFSLQKGFEIRADGDIVFLGKFHLRGYNLHIILQKGDLWYLGAYVHSTNQIISGNGNNFYMKPSSPIKHPEMRDELWQLIIRALQQDLILRAFQGNLT
jgi:hypothetical protein